MIFIETNCNINDDWFDYIVGIGPIIAALIAVGIALWQGKIQEKQKNLALLEKRLNLYYKFQKYVEDKLKNCLEPQLNVSVLKESYENLTNFSGEAFLLFNKDISDKIMDLAKVFEELKTSIHYNIAKNDFQNSIFYEDKEVNYEKDISVVYGKATNGKNLLLGEMHLIMREDKI